MLPPRPPSTPRDWNGLPAASPLERRAAIAVTAVATVWFALAAAWEMFGPILAGHYASSASVGIIAENMLRYRIAGPVWEYTASRPPPEMYYCHHPWGIFWTTAALMKVFGRHDFVCRLPAVLLSAATPPLLYALGRSIHRPAAGAAAAASFVVLPITLSFASFNALEVPVMAWTLLGLWAYVRHTQTYRRRHLAASALGFTLAMHCDWPGFVLTGALLAFGAVRAFAIPRSVLGPVNPRRYAQWWTLTAAALALTAGLYVALFHQSNKLGDLLSSYAFRSSGNNQPLRSVLAGRRYWIELSFTPIAVALGKVGAVVSLGRLLVLRREHEAIALLYLLMAAVQYVVFRQGADIHIFWPHYFAAYFALAASALVATLAAGIERALGAMRAAGIERAPGAPAALAALGVWMLPLGGVLRDGVPTLRYARETGGRFNERGHLIDSDGDKTAFLRWLAERLPERATVELHDGMKGTWAQVWALGGRVVTPNRPLPHGTPRGAYLADTRFLQDDVQADLTRRFHVVAVGPFWAFGEAVPGEAGIEASSFREREPDLLSWYFVSGTEPEREIVPDPFLTWELRAHFGQPVEFPAAPPETLEQRRIAHNAALASGDAARAAALLAEIEAALAPVRVAAVRSDAGRGSDSAVRSDAGRGSDSAVRSDAGRGSDSAVRFTDGTELLGTTYHEGARSLLTLYVRAAGPMASGVALTVRSKVAERAPLSATMADPIYRDVGLPSAIAPQRWKAGFLYASAVPVRKRPGTEVFWASFTADRGGAPADASKSRERGRAPEIEGGAKEIEVLRLH